MPWILNGVAAASSKRAKLDDGNNNDAVTL
jgi:hypothetical protein